MHGSARCGSRPAAAQVTGSVKSIARDRWGVKLLGRGAEDFKHSVTLEVQRASRPAIAAIEAAGGSVVCRYYNRCARPPLAQTPRRLR